MQFVLTPTRKTFFDFVCRLLAFDNDGMFLKPSRLFHISYHHMANNTGDNMTDLTRLKNGSIMMMLRQGAFAIAKSF
jgi:hypothetical protein